MSCPTCSATMHGIGSGMFHCPRCGSLKGGYADGSVTVPALVERCRAFARETEDSWAVEEAWKRLGIVESIAPESERT